ncbi:MAG: S-layer homology domain-containing protein, partial [Bacillota bacterium]|nr:S-layer homology domain-containing protein [Bacillota bacterium]
GHWGLLGVDYSETDNGAPVNPTTATPQEIAKVGHEKNAIVIVHHPYSDYGFLNNQASVNGGTSEGWDSFDLLELQSTMDLEGMEETLTDEAWKSIDMNALGESVKKLGLTNIDANALISAMAFWNNGVEKYLSAGSDQHDAASATLYPGIIRMYAHLGEGSDKASECTVDKYKEALTSGHAYATMGPIFMPAENTEFGSTQVVKEGDKITFSMEIEAVNGLSEVTLWNNGKAVDAKKYYKDSTSPKTKVSFTVTPDASVENLWYSFTCKDANGNYAATNPIWVDFEAKPVDPIVNIKDMTDVKAGAWYYDYVEYVLAKGIMRGDTPTTFSPNANITRGQFVTILGRMSGVEDSSASATVATKFGDVKSHMYYAAHVKWATEKGIVKGVTEDTFAPDAQITRQDMATMIGRYAKAMGIDLPASDGSKFADDASIKDYAKDSVYSLKAAGILSGRGGNQFQPKANATRAEAAKIMNLLNEM